MQVGETPIQEIICFDNKKLFFKREDLNPSGSFKDRLIHYIWTDLQNIEQNEIIIPSSGNFAISFLYFVQKYKNSNKQLNKKIKIFIKDNLPEKKIDKLKKLIKISNSELVICPKRPKSKAIQYAKKNNAYLLRASKHVEFSKAYETLAKEIVEYEQKKQKNFSQVFICCSSGTASVGLIQGLQKLNRKLPVIIVQTSHINSIAKEFDKQFIYEKETEANAISDRVANNKKRLIRMLKKINGFGVVIENKLINRAKDELNKAILNQDLIQTDYQSKQKRSRIIAQDEKKIISNSNSNSKDLFSGNAALSLAGYIKYLKLFKNNNKSYDLERPLIIISGN